MPNNRKFDRRAANRDRFEDRGRKAKAYSRTERRDSKRAARNWALEG